MKTILFITFISIVCALPSYAHVMAPPAPTIDPVTNPAAIAVNAGIQTIQLTGISDDNGDLQGVTITASSSNTALIPNPSCSLATPTSTTGSLSYTPQGTAGGTAIITVRVSNASFPDTYTEIMFTVTVNAVASIINLNAESGNILIYPNPTTGPLHLDLSGEQGISSIVLLNVLGEKMNEYNPSELRQNIQIDHLKSGIYYFVITKSTNKRLIKSIRKL